MKFFPPPSGKCLSECVACMFECDLSPPPFSSVVEDADRYGRRPLARNENPPSFPYENFQRSRAEWISHPYKGRRKTTLPSVITDPPPRGRLAST